MIDQNWRGIEHASYLEDNCVDKIKHQVNFRGSQQCFQSNARTIVKQLQPSKKYCSTAHRRSVNIFHALCLLSQVHLRLVSIL